MLPAIPFNRPCLAGGEFANIESAIRSGHGSAKGPFSSLVSERLRSIHLAADALLTTSCTDALEMTAMLLGLGPGDVVIMPSFTFTSTATAFARQGAKIRFCDIRRPELGLDPDHVRASMSPEVRAIVTVHYAGVPSALDELCAIASEFDVPLVEDNAHGLFATHRGRPLGSFGRMSALSFHETKNFVCGEGGAIVLNDPDDVEHAHVLLDKGTNRRQFLDGAVDKYTWQGHGSSFGLSDLLAAFLHAQLTESDAIRSRRRHVSTAYRRLLEEFVPATGIELQYEAPDAEPADHMFYVLLPDASKRLQIIEEMRSGGVHPAFHYVPLHSAPGAVELGDRAVDCPVTDDISGRLLRLPFYNDLTDQDLERVVHSLVGALAAV